MRDRRLNTLNQPTPEIRGRREKKREKFVELAEKRTQRVLDSIDSLSNLATPSNYEYTERDYKKIIRTIRASLNQMQAKFEGKQTKKKGFVL